VWSPCNDGAKSDVDREGALTWGRGVIGSESSIGRLQVATAGLAVVGKTRSTIDLGRSGLYGKTVENQENDFRFIRENFSCYGVKK
jgi:hypothetical protein